MERRQRGQTDQHLPVFEDVEGDVERPCLREQRPFDQQRVERNVVVDEEPIHVEVAGVGRVAANARPAALAFEGVHATAATL